MARLKIGFRGAETVVSLARGETTVGRSNRCTIHLPDPRLAEVHFRIRRRGDGYQLKDDGSGIGTRVNGKPVFATTLRHGDTIEAGGLRCVFLAEAGAAEAVREPAAVRPPPPAPVPARPDHTWTWLLVAAGAVILLAAVFLLLRKPGGPDADALWKQATVELEAARTAPDDADARLQAAVKLLERIRDEHGTSGIAGTAAMALADARQALADLDRVAQEGRRAEGGLSEEEVQEAFVRLGRLKASAHPAVAKRILDVEDELRRARIVRAEREFARTRDEALACLAERRFGDALDVWRAFAPEDYLYRQRAARERGAVEQRIAEEYRGLLKLAQRDEELDARIELLEANRPVFKGTPQASDLEVRIGALRARRTAPVTLRETAPPPGEAKPPREGKPPAGKEPVPAEAEEKGPYEDPPAVRELVTARRYGQAAALLHTVSRHPAARVRAEELTLLANLFADLGAAVHARPAEFTQVLLPEGGGRADAVDADADGLLVRKDGAESRLAWSELPPKSFVRLFRQAGFQKPPRLALALFFDEENQPKEAEAHYADFFRSEQDPALLTRILARRRGIPEPEGGFRLFRGRVVTIAEEQDTLLREEIEKLGRQARSTLANRRAEAFDGLEKLGPPAAETLGAALKERRQQVAEELAGSRAFSKGRFASALGSQLRAAREAALAFILDGNRYPYPATSEEPQKEAERLVEAVREICDRPYARLLEKSDEAAALDAELKELDGRLARVDPLAAPLYDETVERVQKELDAVNVPLDERDRKRLQYNAAVAKYNRELKDTTADAEERANVEAVNEYRSMMGLEAVKIDERLVRASRKHSIEMRQREYFAHESPTPHLRSPGQRAQREGYSGGVSENIARGAADGRQAFWQWYKSSGHHRNMLMPGHRDMGCGSESHHWWTQMFGRLTGNSLTPPKVPPDPDPPGTSGNGDPPPSR